jgi:hypothetical protein
MTLWSTYWTNETVLDNGGEPLDHLASDQFPTRGISVDDTVYVVNWKRGRLRVLGSMVVGEVCDQARAEAVLGEARYRAQGHLLAANGSGTVVLMNRWLSDDDLRAVEFASDAGPIGPRLNRNGNVDHQSFRSTREITATTKRIFDSVLGPRPRSSRAPKAP